MASLSVAQARFLAHATEERLGRFARELGVAPRALRALRCGIATRADLDELRVGFAKGGRPTEALAFPEHDASGELVGFCFRASDGSKGTATGTRRGIVRSSRPEQPGPRMFVEGPSDAAAAETMFLSPIGRPSARSAVELVADMPDLDASELLVIADSDPAGLKGAEEFARALAERIQRGVSCVQLPEGTKDVRAHLVALGIDVEDVERCAAEGVRLLDRLRKRSRVFLPEKLTRCIAEIESRPIEWVLHPCIPLGKLSLLSGLPGLGKSLLTIDMGARATLGHALDGCEAPSGPVDVLFMSAEDDPADTIRPRLEAAGANLDRVYVTSCLDLEALDRMLDECPEVRLVFVDPIGAYTGHLNTHNDAQVRTLLAGFQKLAHERRIAIVLVSHRRKSDEGDAIMQPGGSAAFAAAARIVWMVLKDPSDEERRLLLPLKSNVGPDSSGFAYRVKADTADGPPRIEWESGRVTESADDVLARTRRMRSGEQGGGAMAQALAFLREQLDDGPRLASDVLEAAQAAGISNSTLTRARRELQVKARKRGMDVGWELFLPPRTPDSDAQAEGDQAPSQGEP